jgi:oligopeptide transport system ATP-binding protein
VVSALLEVRNLATQFQTLEGTVNAVNGISYTLDEGGTLGIVGESGCGKSVSVLSVMRLIPQPPGKIVAGEVLFRGQDLLKLNGLAMQRLRGKEIAMVFQDPMTSLNPVLTIGRQISEALTVHLGMGWDEARQRTVELLEMVGIPKAANRYGDYPHQFSGGMRQRVMIAMALSCNPSLLIADEPTTALDVTIQAQIIDLVKGLRDRLGMAVIWITHDLGIIAGLAERVIVMYAGFIVERGGVDEIYGDPRHPYTLALLKSLPRVDRTSHERLATISGMPPDLLGLTLGCPFAPRCGSVIERCRQENPQLRAAEVGHEAACWVDVTTGREW